MSTELVTTQKLLVKLPKNVDKPQEQLDLQYEQSLAALVALKDEQTLPAEIRQHADRLTKWLNRENDSMENMDTSTRLTQIAMVQPHHAACGEARQREAGRPLLDCGRPDFASVQVPRALRLPHARPVPAG